MSLRLQKHEVLTGTMKVLNGLRVGSGAENLEIGALDNPIVRHPYSQLPYLPGSSLKGKLRALLETHGHATNTHSAKPQPEEHKDNKGNLLWTGPCACAKCAVCWLFGCGDPNKAREPTRLIFRDAYITATHREKLRGLLDQGVLYSETKSEIVMDRGTGRVVKIGPRTMDRIMAGTELDLCISVRVFEGDDVDEIKGVLVDALKMLHQDTLGGSGTRGYGWVGFPKVLFGGEDITSRIHTKDELQRMDEIDLDK